MKTLNRQIQQLEAPANTSLVCGSAAESLNAKSVSHPRREKTPKGERMSLKHSVFVLGQDGKPLTPTTPAKARKMIRAGVAIKSWSKFGTFGIQMRADTRTETPDTVIGNDWGTKFDGYSVIVGTENHINVMLILPNKKVVVSKLEERRILRRARRHRNCRRREARFDNRKRKADWLAPSQAAIVDSRLKIIQELCRIFPVNHSAIEDVRFNHAKHRWGKNFSTVEIGKTRLRNFFENLGIQVHLYEGWQTKEIRTNLGYRKTSIKNAEKFTAHCSDSLSIAANTTVGTHVEQGLFLIVDDSYRPKRRRLHDTQPAKGGIRAPYSKGTVLGLRKGLLVGIKNKVGQLCGELKGGYRYTDAQGKRQSSKTISWISSNFRTRVPKAKVSRLLPALKCGMPAEGVL